MKAHGTFFLASLLLTAAGLPAGEYDNPVPWSYQPVKRPAVPEVKDADWPRDDLDKFILARLEQENLKPVGDAPRAVWIRRASFDLRGLPPSQEEVTAFVSDPSNDETAYAKVVDAFLQSERFGERWARHWLDVVRYADSIGRVWNAPFLYAFRYRDWVIDSFNADKPYNRFMAEQIAGDLLPAKTVAQRRDQITGTGMLALGSLSLQEGSYEQYVLDQVDDQMDVTSRAFLGLTLSCARCHDHKTDPVSQRDYYALAGIFYSSRTLSGLANRHDLTRAGYVDPEMLVDLPAAVDEPVGPPQKLPAGVHSMDDIRSLGNPKKVPHYDMDPHFCMGVVDGDVRDCELAVGGDPHERETAPQRGAITIPGLPPLPSIANDASGRLELARWIASPTHPLTARVMVNRVWQHLFGEGMVRTVDDFGTTGADPTHPELLDHLALRFIENGWSVKRLIRSLMLSRSYRLASSSGTAADAEHPDAGNRLHWRMNVRRLEIEPLRDSLMQLAGRLDLARPEGIQVGGTGGKGRLGVTQSFLGAEDPFRSVYLPVIRDGVPELFSTFDFPGPTQIKGQRDVTTTPPQSLFFMNSPFMENVAEEIAARIAKEDKDEASTIHGLYLYLLGREPLPEETADAAALLESLEGPGQATRWTTLVQALLGSAEFRYVF